MLLENGLLKNGLLENGLLRVSGQAGRWCLGLRLLLQAGIRVSGHQLTAAAAAELAALADKAVI